MIMMYSFRLLALFLIMSYPHILWYTFRDGRVGITMEIHFVSLKYVQETDLYYNMILHRIRIRFRLFSNSSIHKLYWLETSKACH